MSREEQIEESIKRLRSETSAETDERILTDASAALQEAVGGKATGGLKIKVSTVVGLGAIAALFIVVLVFASYLGRIAEQQAQDEDARVAGISQVVEPIDEQRAKIERREELFEAGLKEAEKLFAARDVDGLIKLLSQGRQESKLAAVIYLAKLGDLGAIDKLEKLSEQYGRDRKDNLFAIAIAAIKSGVAQERAVAKERQGPREDLAAKAGRREGYINGWLVDTNGNSLKGRIWFAGENVITNEAGEFEIPVNTLFPKVDRRIVSNLALAHNWEQSLWSVFAFEKGQDFNDLELVLTPAASISGYVVDRDGNPAGDFELVLNVPVDSNSWEMPFIDVANVWAYHKNESRAWQMEINDDGSFVIDSIPTGIDLLLAVKKPGFKTLVELSQLQPGSHLDLGEIVLEPLEGFDEQTQWNCRLWGRVIDEANEPISNGRLFAKAGEEKFETDADANGRYLFDGLPNDVNMMLSFFFNRFGETVFFHTCTDVNERLDIQFFPPAYDWYGKEAPGIFVAKWLNSEPMNLEQLKGEIVLLCVGWDSFYQPGIIGEVEEIFERYKDQAVTVIAIHKRLLERRTDEAALIKYIEEKGIGFPCAIDADVNEVKDFILPQQRYRFADKIGLRPGYYTAGFSPGATYSLYEVSARLRYYIIDKNGILRASPAFENVDKWIERLLSE